jgi:hypothetical protein
VCTPPVLGQPQNVSREPELLARREEIVGDAADIEVDRLAYDG